MKIVSKKEINSTHNKLCALCHDVIYETENHIQTVYENENEECYILDTHKSCSNLIYDLKMNDGSGISSKDFFFHISRFFHRETNYRKIDTDMKERIKFVKRKFGYK